MKRCQECALIWNEGDCPRCELLLVASDFMDCAKGWAGLVAMAFDQRDEAREDLEDMRDGLKAIIDIRVDERDEARRIARVLYKFYLFLSIWNEHKSPVGEDLTYSINEAKRELPWL